MNLPWVSRARFEDALQQIAELKSANSDLLKLALTKTTESVASSEPEKEPEPSRPHRKLGATLRAEFRAQAEARAAEAKINAGAKR